MKDRKKDGKKTNVANTTENQLKMYLPVLLNSNLTYLDSSSWRLYSGFLQRNTNRPVYVQNIYDYISAGMENEDDKNWWKK